MPDAPIVLIALLGIGIATAVIYGAYDLVNTWHRDQELIRQTCGAWQRSLASLLACTVEGAFDERLSLTIDGADVEVHAPSEDVFEVSGRCPERDLVVRVERSGDVFATGSGWDALDAPSRRLLETFARAGGTIGFGRATLRAHGIEAAADAARQIAGLAKVLGGSGKLHTSAILRRVTSAEDPGRVSLAETPPTAGRLSESSTSAAVTLMSKNLVRTVTRIWAATGAGDDRVLAIPFEDRVVLVVADGAGGTGGGAAAAERILARVQQVAAALCSGVYEPAELLEELDRTLAPTGGEAAAVVAIVSPTSVRGACAGDVEAILFAKGEFVVDLTSERRRKPLLGSGNVKPVSFSSDVGGRLLIATDGLFGYAKHDRVIEALRADTIEDVPERLIALVRLPNGKLHDDVGIVVSE